MRACPVCETPCDDRAVECPNCGKEFIKVAIPDAPAAALPDLDLGRIDGRALQIVADATPDVEHVSEVQVGEVSVEVAPDLERTAGAPVGDVGNDATPDVERTELAAKEWTPDEEGPVLCRACRSPQADPNSIFCQSCGYRLPVRKLQEAVLVLSSEPGGAAEPEVSEIKCPQCGCMTPPGGLCRACGVTLRAVGT
jgi:hypothetical protein